MDAGNKDVAQGVGLCSIRAAVAACIAALVLAAALLAVGASTARAVDASIGDEVYFGAYAINRHVDSSENEDLCFQIKDLSVANGSPWVTFRGDRYYCENYSYQSVYEVESIPWIVVGETSNCYVLMSKYVLGGGEYGGYNDPVWEAKYIDISYRGNPLEVFDDRYRERLEQEIEQHHFEYTLNFLNI